VWLDLFQNILAFSRLILKITRDNHRVPFAIWAKSQSFFTAIRNDHIQFQERLPSADLRVGRK
jgi:hypothetical protein